jgi:hypothetical protein
MDLFNYKQQPKEPLSQYYKRFIQIKSQITNILEVVIIAAIKGLQAGQCATHLTQEKPTSLAQLYEEIQKYCKSNEDYRKRIEEENSFRNQNKRSNFHPPKQNNYERRRFSQVNQVENNNSTTESNFPPQNQYNSQYNKSTFKRDGFNARGRGGRGRGRTPLRPEDMYCIIHGKGARHTSKMCPKVKKRIKETQEENKMSSQPKSVNHMIQGQQNFYYPIQFGYSQVMIPGPSPSYSYGPVEIYDPNQWRQNQQQTNFQQLQPESSVANNNP